MPCSNTARLLASTAVLLASAGCMSDHVDMESVMSATAAEIAEPPPGHQLHRMFHEEKRDAAAADLPAQF